MAVTLNLGEFSGKRSGQAKQERKAGVNPYQVEHVIPQRPKNWREKQLLLKDFNKFHATKHHENEWLF